MDITLKVSPETMIQKADSIKNEISIIKSNLDNISHIVNNSTRYWNGKASNHHKSLYEKNREKGENIIKRLNKNPEQLLRMAGIYIEGENKSEEAANQLPNNILS